MAALLWGLLWITLLPGLAQETADIDTATTIRALESRWVTAEAHHDSGALNLIFDNDLVYIEYGRLLTKGDYLLKVKSQKDGVGQGLVAEAMTIQRFGNAAIVIGTYREQRAAAGKISTRRWRFEDTWVYVERRWVLVSAGASPVMK